jgi:hypothetical protein
VTETTGRFARRALSFTTFRRAPRTWRRKAGRRKAFIIDAEYRICGGTSHATTKLGLGL